MLHRSLWRFLIGPLDLKYGAMQKSIMGKEVRKQPIAAEIVTFCRVIGWISVADLAVFPRTQCWREVESERDLIIISRRAREEVDTEEVGVI